jgi:hypothetical protein
LTHGIDLFADLKRVGSRRAFFKAFHLCSRAARLGATSVSSNSSVGRQLFAIHF